MRTVYGEPTTLESHNLADAFLSRVDAATGIIAAQRIAGAAPILNDAETALIWSSFAPLGAFIGSSFIGSTLVGSLLAPPPAP